MATDMAEKITSEACKMREMDIRRRSGTLELHVIDESQNNKRYKYGLEFAYVDQRTTRLAIAIYNNEDAKYSVPMTYIDRGASSERIHPVLRSALDAVCSRAKNDMRRMFDDRQRMGIQTPAIDTYVTWPMLFGMQQPFDLLRYEYRSTYPPFYDAPIARMMDACESLVWV